MAVSVSRFGVCFVLDARLRRMDRIIAASAMSIENESDAGLFIYLSFLETDPVHANVALRELMRRYGAILGGHCRRLCARFPSLGIDGDELANATFYRASERASTYKPLDKDGADAEDHMRYTRAWLCKIASNLLFDAGRSEDRELPYEREFS